MNPSIIRIRSGGQSGVDRAALDFARKHNIEICGWCPEGYQVTMEILEKVLVLMSQCPLDSRWKQ